MSNAACYRKYLSFADKFLWGLLLGLVASYPVTHISGQTLQTALTFACLRVGEHVAMKTVNGRKAPKRKARGA